jgi:cobalamin biosynthesis protein CbiG
MDFYQIMLSEIAIGLGCRQGVAAEPVEILVRQVLAEAPLYRRAALFTIARRAGEPGLRQAAAELGLQLTFFDEVEFLDRQQEFLARGATPSVRARALTGLSSVAEGAALMGGGPQAQLLVPRRSASSVTCAIAADPSKVET